MNAKSKAASRRCCSPSATGTSTPRKCCSSHGANVNDVAPDGTSALNMAVVNAYYELASVLLDHGADPECARPARLGAAPLAWLRKPGSDGAGRRRQRRHWPARAHRQREIARNWPRRCSSTARIPMSASNGRKADSTRKAARRRLPADISSSAGIYLTYVGATPFYVAAQNGDAALHAPARRSTAPIRRCRPTPDITPLMVACRARLLGGREPRPVHRRVRKRSVSRP